MHTKQVEKFNVVAFLQDLGLVKTLFTGDVVSDNRLVETLVDKYDGHHMVFALIINDGGLEHFDETLMNMCQKCSGKSYNPSFHEHMKHFSSKNEVVVDANDCKIPSDKLFDKDYILSLPFDEGLEHLNHIIDNEYRYYTTKNKENLKVEFFLAQDCFKPYYKHILGV